METLVYQLTKVHLEKLCDVITLVSRRASVLRQDTQLLMQRARHT